MSHFVKQGTKMAFSAAAPFSAARFSPLACLARTGMENLFQSWLGASGRRYICSVYSVDEPPSFDCARAIVAAVRKNAGEASIAFVFRPDTQSDGGDWRLWARKAGACGATEWHVHLLAGSQEERNFTLQDLAAQDLASRRLALAA
jgi:hypothetical protein